MTNRRDEIEKYYRNFLHENGHQQLHKLIGNYEHEFSHIDIQQFTKDTFDGSFQSICNDVFTYRHIIAILDFTEPLHKHHCSSSWYTMDILRDSLVNVREGIGFHPEQLTPSRCIIL